MTIDDIYKLVITYLVKGYPVNLEPCNLSDYRANGELRIRTRMIIRILGIDLAQIGWDDDDEYGPVNGWDNLENFEKYVS